MATVANITRRHALKLLPAGLAAAGVPAMALAVEPSRDPVAHAEYLAGELAKAMSAINPEREYDITFGGQGSVFILPVPLPSSAIYDGPNYYEVSLQDGRRPILWVERDGNHYVGAHCWGGRFETNPRRYSEKQIRLVRKVADYSKNWGA